MLGLSLGLFCLALLSKINSLSFVFVIGCLLLFAGKNRGENLASSLPFLVIAVGFAIFDKIMVGSLTGAIQSWMIPFHSRGISLLARSFL